MAPNDGTVPFAVEADGQVIGLIQYSEKNEQDDRHAAIDIFLHPDGMVARWAPTRSDTGPLSARAAGPPR